MRLCDTIQENNNGGRNMKQQSEHNSAFDEMETHVRNLNGESGNVSLFPPKITSYCGNVLPLQLCSDKEDLVKAPIE